jgi:(R,R)-butanediol dehydrogenase/meso-butanediol dehydrogenase/diacetyl reductase
MKASFYEGNRTFTLREGEVIAPGPGEVRLNVAYTGICGTDLHVYHGAMDKRVRIPQVIGHEMSGTVAEIGEGVKGFSIGTPVVVRPLDNRAETPADRGYSHICNKLKFMGVDTTGSLQSSWTVPVFTVHKIPSGLDLKTAALVEPLAVACHDVRIGAVESGELVVVIGAGPIGMLVSLVARHRGARVVISEVNPFRIEFARSLGFEASNPKDFDLAAWVREESAGSGADVVFEVSGSKVAALDMTDLLAIRGRIVLVAIYPQPVELNLFQFFWKELRLFGARVYEPCDYEKAIEIAASRALPLESLITDVHTLDHLTEVFKHIDSDPNAMKTLIDCQS